MEEEDSLGISFIDGKFVCHDCFDEEFIKEHIKSNLCNNKCSYCEKVSAELIAASMNCVLQFIAERINQRWEDPAESVAYDEGEYIGAKIIDAEDLIDNELDLGINNKTLRKELIESISSKHNWCKKDPYGLWPHEEDLFEWQKFSKQVMHQSRYVFYKIKNRKNLNQAYEQPYEILERVGQIVVDLNLIKTLDINTCFYRARELKRNEIIRSAKEIGTPPIQYAIYSNRMSPAGIPMFYGANEFQTAVAEIFHKNLPSEVYCSIGKFKTLRTLNILDLSRLPNIPSLLDRSRSDFYESIIFMYEFVDDLKKPISKDGQEHIEYVPTQVITEYFRHIFKYKKKKLDGIIYKSSCHRQGTCCILFVDNENCVEENEIGILALEKSSLIKYKIIIAKCRSKIKYKIKLVRKMN